MNLPNKITLTRIFLVFVFMAFLFIHGLPAKITALVIFIIAALTDYLDGYIAKKYNIVPDFGQILHPVAEKIMNLVALLATL